MSLYTAENLSNAVAAICPDIQSQMQRTPKVHDERALWWELSSCILSSQVPYPLAIAAANRIDKSGFLLRRYSNEDHLQNELINLLMKPLIVEGKPRNYRFPVVRAQNLARCHSIIINTKHSLTELICSFDNAIEARKWLVKYVPGIGPKQSSMFLRNVGVSYDLAILDRHVLNYMLKLGIYSGTKLFISSFKQYYKYEADLQKHAYELNCPVGLLDWAIWIVMRVANQKDAEPITI
jgi:N-glycosylase/DNA lyase